MALDLVPSRLPSLEGYKAALKAAIAADWADAVTAVQADYPDPDMVIELPKRITTETISRYEQVRAWPTVSIIGGIDALTQPTDQPGHGQWTGSVQVVAYLQDNTRLADGAPRMPYLIERYQCALWLIVINNNPLAGAQLVDGTMELGDTGAEEIGGKHLAAVGLRYDVRYRT